MLELDDEKKRRRFALLVSLVVHGVFFTLCILIIVPIKVYIQDEVRFVVVAPSDNLVIPSWDELVSPPGIVTGGQSQEDPEVLALGSGQGTVQTDLRIESESQIKSPGVGVSFQLPSLGRKQSEILKDHPFSLSLSSARARDPLNWEGKNTRNRDIDFQKYSDIKLTQANAQSFLRSFSGIRFDPSRAREIISRNEEYDLSIWADKVIAVIQQNWFMKPSHLEETEGQVKVSMVVGKKGELMSAKIDGSPSSALLEKSAMAALEMSAPFPALPDAFPGEGLRILLIFSMQ